MLVNVFKFIFLAMVLFCCVPAASAENNMHFGISFNPSILVEKNPYDVFWGGRIFVTKDIFFIELQITGASDKTREVNAMYGGTEVLKIYGMNKHSCYVYDDRYYRTMSNTRAEYYCKGFSLGVIFTQKIFDNRLVCGILKAGASSNTEIIYGDFLGSSNVKLCEDDSGVIWTLGTEAAIELIKIYDVIILFNAGYEFQSTPLNIFKISLGAML